MDLATQLRNIERLLKKRVFIGQYTERLRIEEVQAYRDVVQLAPEEVELGRDLSSADAAFLAVDPHCYTSHTGVTGVLPLHCLYVRLSDLPFGCHWFQIKSVSLTDSEVIYKLKCLRTLSDVKFESRMQHVVVSRAESSLDRYTDITIVNELKSRNNADLIVGVFRFLVVLFTTLITGFFHVVNFVGDFTIRFIRESSLFINASTPMFLGFLEFISKIIGGFYILLAMLWRGSKPVRGPPVEALDYNRPTFQPRARTLSARPEIGSID